MLELETKNEIKLLQADNLKKLEWLEHAFTTRIGGVSSGVFNQLNLYSNLPEEKENVLINRKKLASVLDFNFKNLVLAQQVHGKRVQVITEKENGRGALLHSEAIPETDALVTNVPGIPLMLLYADCLPLLIVDKTNHAVGVAHAGWKGTAQSILTETIETMINSYGSKKENLLIAIGIGINQCCFEIGADAKEKLSKVTFSDFAFTEKNNSIYADLVEINKSQAVNYGVPEANIAYNKILCTFCNQELFYSYRRDNKITGRHSAVIYIKK